MKKINTRLISAFLIFMLTVLGGLGSFQAKPAYAELSGFKSVAGGAQHSLAVRWDGTVWAWGKNDYGQLGDGTKINRTTPVQVQGLTGITEVAAANTVSLALKNDGTVWAWGQYLQSVGVVTSLHQVTPVRVEGLTDVVRIATAVNAGHYLALKRDGTVWGWGSAYSCVLADGKCQDFYQVPQQIKPSPGTTLPKFVQISAAPNHSLAVDEFGNAWGWGNGNKGELGDGSSIPYRMYPKVILTGVTSISGGQFFTIASKSDGTVWQSGELPGSTQTYYFAKLPTLTSVIRVSANSYECYALKVDGTMWFWGIDGLGVSGSGKANSEMTAISNSSPLQVSTATGLTKVSQLVTGGSHTFVIAEDSSLWGWGGNEYKKVDSSSDSVVLFPRLLTSIPAM